MIALIWKELRENLKWALLAMVCLGGAELYGLYQTQNGQPEYYSYTSMTGITLTKVSFLIVTTFGPAAIGFLLGLVQILPELKADRWAALLHRPVPRSRIFWGKAAAGVLLYLIAAVPPFLLCVWLVATPGHFPAPFVPGLTLPGTADTFTGLVYYFAALAVALQRGGWVVLRGLPLLAALHTSFFTVSCQTFGDAMGAAALMMVALCVAAWGAMHHQWSFGARPWLGKVAFFAAAFYGLCGIADLIGAVFNAADDNSTFTNYELSREGIPLKIHYVHGIVVSVQNLDGSEPQSPDYKPDRVRNHITYLNSASSYIGNPHGWKHSEDPPPYRQPYTYLAAMYPFEYPHMEQWFYLRAERAAIGMLPRKKMPIQRLDAQGFHSPSGEPVPFAPSDTIMTIRSDGYSLWNSKSIRFADLAQRKITDVALPIPGEIFGATTAWASSDSGGNVQATAVALATIVAVYDNKDGSLLTTLPYHRDVDRWGSVAVGLNGAKDRFYLWYYPSDWLPRAERMGMSSYIDEMNLQGEVLHSYILPPLPEPPKRVSSLEYLSRRLQSPTFFFGTLLYEKAGAALGSERLRDALARQLNEDWPRTREIAVHIPVFSAFFAVITLFWARRVHLSWRRAGSWAALVLLFNLAGFLAFRLLADWPRLVSCAACRRPRPIAEESCPACGDGWPQFQPNGTEIFDHPAEHLEDSATPA